MDEQGQEPVEELTLEPPTAVRSNRPRALWAVLAFLGMVAGGLVVSSANDDGDQPGLPVDLASATRSGAGGAEAAADSMLAWVVYVPGDDLPALGGEATAYRLSGDVDEARVRELADALGLAGDVQSDGTGGWSVSGEGGEGRLDVGAGGGPSWSYFAGYSDCQVADGSVASCSGAGSSAGSSAGAGEDCVRKGDVTECVFEDYSTGQACPPGADCAAPTTTVVAYPECPPNAVCLCSAPDASTDCAEPPTTTPCFENQTEAPDECLPPPPPPDTGSGCGADDCIETCGPGACPDVEPSADLPDEDDARAAALRVVQASGADVDGARVTAEPGFNSWYVTVEPEVDGLPSGLISYVEVGPDLRVTSGGGFVGQPEALGEYPLLDTRAAIERANQQNGTLAGIEPAIAADDGVASTTGGTDTGGTDDLETTITTAVQGGTDRCLPPEGASDGCGGTTGCGGDGCVEPTTTIPCKVQPDGSEICEMTQCARETSIGTAGGDDPAIDVQPCTGPACPELLPPEDGAAAPETAGCPPPVVEPVPLPAPAEMVLVDAERSLVLLPANDGSGDAYLVPAYRFTAADGGTVDLPAVADEALAGPVTTETTVPDTIEPSPVPVPVPEPQPCEVLEEQGTDGESATTLTVQTCPTPEEEDALQIGGDGYYVDIDVECAGGTFELGSRIWITDDEEVAGWADPGERHEGGTFTLDAEDHGTFVGDAAGTLVAEFRTLGPAEDIFCTPQPR